MEIVFLLMMTAAAVTFVYGVTNSFRALKTSKWK